MLLPINENDYERKVNTADNARLDISVRGLWNSCEKTFFDIGITHLTSASYSEKSLARSTKNTKKSRISTTKNDHTKRRAGGLEGHVAKWKIWIFRGLPAAEMITIRFAGTISSRIVSLQPDRDIQNLLWNGNRIRIQISETLLLIFRWFRLLEKFAHCTVIHLLSSFRSIFSAICSMTPSLSMVYSLHHSVISLPS